MDRDMVFRYHYSAKENKEIQEIRNKYLPQGESKLQELRRLDASAQSAGIIESLVAGIGGMLLFIGGICLIAYSAVLGGLLVGCGIGGMVGAYPVYRKKEGAVRAKLTPRILQLIEEISENG